MLKRPQKVQRAIPENTGRRKLSSIRRGNLSNPVMSREENKVSINSFPNPRDGTPIKKVIKITIKLEIKKAIEPSKVFCVLYEYKSIF